MKTYFYIFLFFLVVFISFAFKTFTLDPPVWPDEAIYHAIITDTPSDTDYSTKLLEIVPGGSKLLVATQPLFFSLLTGWFTIQPPTLYNQRLFSLCIGIMFMFIYFLMALTLSKKFTRWSMLTVLALVLHPSILTASKLNRPEIIVLLFGFTGMLCLLLGLKQRNASTSFVFYALSGLCVSFATLSHIIGAYFFLVVFLYLCIEKGLHLFRRRELYLFLGCFLLPVGVHAISLLQEPGIYREFMTYSTLRQKLSTNWLYVVFNTQPLMVQVSYAIYAAVGIIAAYFALRLKSKQFLWIFIANLVVWLFVYRGNTHWYYVYLIPFVYLALQKLVETALSNAVLTKTIRLLLIGSILISLHTHAQLFLNLDKIQLSAKVLSTEALRLIPDHASVFLSIIPDQYESFRAAGRSNQVYEFPYLNTSKEHYAATLNESDYVVFNGRFELPVSGNFLQEYIEKNKMEVYYVGTQNNPLGLIFKLKPRNERIRPE